MKLFYPLAIILLLIVACSKPKPDVDTPDEPPPVDHNLIPPATPVNTIITVYAETNDQYSNPMSVRINGDDTNYEFGGFSTNTSSSTEKYDCNIDIMPARYSGFLHTVRNVTLTSASRNNVDVSSIRAIYLDRLFSTDAGEWKLGEGKLSFAANTFEQPEIVASSPAYAILDPTANAFSITNPSFTADVDEHRWYLRSYGVVLLDIPYKLLGKMTLQYPIPASLLSTAPDSIATWLYLNNRWKQQGYAKKTGNLYIKDIQQGGIWSFGEMEEGIYKTFKVRTSNGLPVANAILRVKSRNNEVASARTDATGTAICFLPAHENLTADILLSWPGLNDGRPAFELPGPFNSDKDEEITLPASSPYLMSVRGTAVNCGGGPIQAGTVTAICEPANSRWYMPITNGQYGSAYLYDYDRVVFLMNASSDAVPGPDTAAMLDRSQDNIVNINTCKPATNLFLKYTIDDVEYNITGDAAIPDKSFLAAYFSYDGTDISCQDDQTHATRDLDFSTSGEGTGTFLNISGLRVNNVSYDIDYGKTLKVTFTRYDWMIGGYVEGSMEAYYKDKADVVHHLVASFRLKRVT